MNKLFSFTLLLFSCAQYTPNDIKYNIPKLWSEPINDYLEIGQKNIPMISIQELAL